MAVANALGQRDSKSVTAAPWKSPMMAWSTVRDHYFRVADDTSRLLRELADTPWVQHAYGALLLKIRLAVANAHRWLLRLKII